MKFNFHWGYGIALFYGLFVVMIIGFVVASTRQDIGILERDYYKLDIDYQQRVDRKNNALADSVQVHVDFNETGQLLEFRFPDGKAPASGQIWLQRPSNGQLDQRFPFTADAANVLRHPFRGKPKGLWRYEINWSENGKPYFQEGTLVL